MDLSRKYKGIQSIQVAAQRRPMPHRCKQRLTVDEICAYNNPIDCKFRVLQAKNAEISFEEKRQNEAKKYLKTIDKKQLLLTKKFLTIMEKKLTKKQLGNVCVLNWQNVANNFANEFNLSEAQKRLFLAAGPGPEKLFVKDKNLQLETINSIISGCSRIQAKVNAKIEAQKSAAKTAKKAEKQLTAVAATFAGLSDEEILAKIKGAMK